MPAQLVSLTDGPNILIDKPILLIGRHPECDIQIDSRKISRRHCCIAQVADYLVVRDLGSTNGIRINGVRVLEGRLDENDELAIGAYRYRISLEQLDGTAAPEPGLRIKAESQPPVPPVAADDDELLEACDQPVPLADSDGGRPGIRGLAPPKAEPFTSSRAECPASPLSPQAVKLASASEREQPDSPAS